MSDRVADKDAQHQPDEGVGSCNTQNRRIWLNLELAKKPPECLEFILVHELAHLLERNHNDRFKAYMDRFLPDWRERRDLLNNMPLGVLGALLMMHIASTVVLDNPNLFIA